MDVTGAGEVEGDVFSEDAICEDISGRRRGL